MLFQIPQRYRFSSKSQHKLLNGDGDWSCFRYHKGTDFQANHNYSGIALKHGHVVLDTTKVQIFKQITTLFACRLRPNSCFRYHKGTDFQANHNTLLIGLRSAYVVLDTTKVQIFKQITTKDLSYYELPALFQIPQRYRFSSKSQPEIGRQQ